MTLWLTWRLPLMIRSIIFCDLLIYLNAGCSNESTLDGEKNSHDDVLLRIHYEKIFKLLEKSVFGERLIRLESKELPIEVWGCVPGNQMVIGSFPIHERSNTSETHRVCSNKIDAAAIVDINNVLARLNQFNDVLNTMNNDYEMKPRDWYYRRGHQDKLKIGIVLIDDCNDESLVRERFENVKNWFSKDPKKNPCLLPSSPGESYEIIGKFSSFPMKSINSTFYNGRTMDLTHPEIKNITKQEVQNFSFETFKDSYIVCSIMRHFGWTEIGLTVPSNNVLSVDLNSESGYRFGKIARFFHICVNELTLLVYGSEETKQLEYQKSLFDLLLFKFIRVYVIFCDPALVLDYLIKFKDWNYRIIFIISEDLLPPDRKLMQNSQFLVFHKEAKQVGEDSMDVENLEFLQEYIMRNGTFNSANEQFQRNKNKLECKFPESEFAFVQNKKSNDKEETSEFSDPHTSSDRKCKRMCLSKLDEIFYKFIVEFCAYEVVCQGILEKLLMQIRVDNSWLKLLYTINLRVEPGNISIGNGIWDDSSRRIIFQTLPDAMKYLPTPSRCSSTCKSGQKEKILSTDEPCCLDCEDCEPKQIIIWNKCLTCQSEEWPNKDRTKCVPKKKHTLQWDDLEIVICTTYSTIIVIMVVTTLWIFIKKRNTPVVKSSTRELSFMMLVSMIAVESTIFIFVSSPDDPPCNLIQIVSSLSFGTIYTSLLVKTVRIARLLALSKNEFPQKDMKCMSTKSQVIITINIIIVIALLVLNYQIPFLRKNRDYIDPQGSVAPMITPICQYKLNIFTSNFSFIFGLVALCTGCAVWVRKVPDNFNEAKYIGFCMYATCLTWIAFGFTLCGGEHGYEILALCACFSTNNLLALIFLFFPKLYIIIFKPKKNHRKYFNTSSKSIRVHKRDSKTTIVPLKNLDERKN